MTPELVATERKIRSMPERRITGVTTCSGAGMSATSEGVD